MRRIAEGIAETRRRPFVTASTVAVGRVALDTRDPVCPGLRTSACCAIACRQQPMTRRPPGGALCRPALGAGGKAERA
jgi:hypothetical protein